MKSTVTVQNVLRRDVRHVVGSIKVTTNDKDEQLVSARDLHKGLEIKTRFSLWVKQNFKNFREFVDFSSVVVTTQQNQYGGLKEIDDYAMTVEMAKHIAMMTGTPKGYEVRDYFIMVEQAWNNPDMVVQRAIQIQQKKIEFLQLENESLKPKALFFDAVSGSTNSCLVKDLSVLLKQNNIEIGQNRLFGYFRKNGYLGRGNGHYNKPTQKSLDRGLFEYREHFHTNGIGKVETRFTPLVTGKGQQYFIDKFLKEGTTCV